MFGICEGIQRFTNAFEEVNDEINQLDWYRYPLEIQQMLVPMMIYLQKPAEIAFFGSIGGNREQFRKVSI